MKRLIFTLFVFLHLFNYNSAFSQEWKLLWQDEFNATISEDWVFDIGYGQWGWGNDEWQNYTTDNAFIVDSALVIRATTDGAPGKRDGSITSAKIKTKNKFNVKYGKIEARIKMSLGKGCWPAFWMLGSNQDIVGWPKCGEIDIMENVNGENIIHGTAHWEGDLDRNSYGKSVTNVNIEEYHVYSIIWDSLAIRWQIDGKTYNTFDITGDRENEFHESFYIILNLAMGGQWPGPPDASSFPSEMIIDYVRVYTFNEPRIGFYPFKTDFEMQEGESQSIDPFTINITNTGIDNLNNVTAETEVDWLDITWGDNEGNEQFFDITLNENADQLKNGSQFAEIIVSASNAVLKAFPVDLQVGYNIVLNNNVTSSSVDPNPPLTENFDPENVNDGDKNTGWSSAYSDPQWISINLKKLPIGPQVAIESVKLYWDSAYATEYEIQLSSSSDFSEYHVIASVTDGDGGIDLLMTDNSVSGNYIRMYGLTRATENGYALLEFEVYKSVTTDISAMDGLIIPHDYDIQNAPNPFNPSTRISYSIPKTQHIKLELYDVHGKRIKTLLSKVQSPGRYNFNFDRNNLASGLYFLLLKTPTKSLTHKMVLLK